MKKKWKEVYLFMFNVKITGCFYFVAFVFFYLVFGVLDMATTPSLNFWTSVQMFIACLGIGFAQGIIIPKNNLSVARILIWCFVSIIITIFFSEWFEWFSMYSNWYSYVFYSCIAISFFFYWLALSWQLQRETKQLNDALYKFKELNK